MREAFRLLLAFIGASFFIAGVAFLGTAFLGKSPVPESLAAGVFLGVPGAVMLVVAWRGYVRSPKAGVSGLATSRFPLSLVSGVLRYVVLGFLLLLVALCFVLAVAVPLRRCAALSRACCAAYLAWRRARRKYYDKRNLERVVELDKEMPEQPIAVLLDPGERVELRGHAFECQYAVRVGGGESHIVTVAFPRLYLTNKRLIIEREETAEGESLEVSIPLEKVVSVRLFDANALIPGLEFKTTLRSPWRHFIVRIPGAAKWRETLACYRAERLKELERRKGGVVVDFSTIRDLLEKGGIVLYTVKYPNCGAPLELPERGNKIRCEHCGAIVYAEDVLKKLSELL